MMCVIFAVIDVAIQSPAILPFYAANPNGISFTEVRIPLRDGNSLAGFAVLPSNHAGLPAGSACLTILSPGVNGRKEAMVWKAYNLALQGFIAIAIEARGHGSSTGICTVGIEEPKDISDAITWALATYPAINASRVSLYGQSLGGMFTVIAACQDARVAATVALHPPGNFSQFFTQYVPIINLLRLTPTFTFDEENLRLRSAINWINASSPRNILFLHGDQDTVVPLDDSISLSQKANASGHTDTYVIIRPGLGHQGNEANHDSLALAIAWLNWSLTQGKNPDPETLWSQAGGIAIYDTPSGSMDLSGNLILVAAAAIFVLIILVFQKRQVDVNPSTINPAAAIISNRRQKYVLVTAAFISAFLLGLLNIIPFIWAYLLVLPLIILGTYLFLGAFLAKRGVQDTFITEWRQKNRIRKVGVGVGAIIGVAFVYAILYSSLAQIVAQYGIFILSTAPLFYSTIIVLNFAIDSLVLDSISWGSLRTPLVDATKSPIRYFKNLGRDAIYVFLWRLGSITLCSLFLPPILFTGFPIAINILILIGLPLLAMLVYFLAGILDIGTKSHVVSLLIIGAIVALYLQWRLFRLF